MSGSRLPSLAAWLAAATLLGGVAFIVVRGCGYAFGPLAGYTLYFAAHVFLPGVVAVAWVNRGPVSLVTSIALGVPTGFALEIGSFLGLAALGAKGAGQFLPLAWGAALAWQWRRRGAGPVRWRITRRHAGVALALAALFFATAIAAATHMFAESPLVDGLPQRPIFHDWVYLVSRAAVIKNLWPLEDPSLAGIELQYHYFLLVHVASASWATGLELTQVLLRFAVVPLGLVLVTQAFALGRLVSRSAWGGVLAALLTVGAGELGFHAAANESVFLGRFVRWLHVSPTFYFGMIFFGAMLLALARWPQVRRGVARHFAWLCVLGAAAAGAKGTVMPVVLAALALWAGWEWWRQGTFPGRLAAAGIACGTVFAGVYFSIMAGWGTGAAAILPGGVLQVSEFWRQNAEGWARGLEAVLPAAWAGPLAAIACGAVVLLGTLGVRALAAPFLFMRVSAAQRPVRAWLGAAALASGALGLLLKLDADGELYLFLILRLPSAALAAGFLVAAARAWAGRSRPTTPARAFAGRSSAVRLALAVPVGLALAVQLAVPLHRGAAGWRDWLGAGRFRDTQAEIGQLENALVWLRRNTESNAVLVVNTYTPANLQRDHWGAVDGTLAGVHYYYSALSERRLLVEGPNYLLDPAQVTRRLAVAAELYYERKLPSLPMLGGAPVYALIDRSVKDGATLPLGASHRVFANSRIEVFRLPPPPVRLAGTGFD